MTAPSVAAGLRSVLADRFRLTPAGECSAPLTLFPHLAADVALEVLRPVLDEKDEEIERLRGTLERKSGSEGEERRG